MTSEEKATQSNNKRIAKNTLLLYGRLLLTMVVSLFTSRVILNTLGMSDYGINNVVAGFVTMFSILTGSLSASISRFLTFALGKNDKEHLNKIFSTSLTIQIFMAMAVAILAEVFGLWFLNSQLNIPVDRMHAANWVYHFSIIIFCINLISVPYNATIIAHERMVAFAYISILEVILKLVIVYMLYISPFDKLITYSALLTGIALIIRLVYGWYCKHHFEECQYHFVFDKFLLKEMTGFAGWNFFGSSAYIFNTQGVNIITNIFFGVTANAARGVANQAEGIIKQFVNNFTTAINPQIIKSYAAGNTEYMFSLVCRGSKFSYFLSLLFVMPFMFETEAIMHLWLKNYPPEAPIFLRLSMVGTLFDILGNSSANAAWATGNIRRYYVIVTTIGCLVFPFSWITFSLGCPAYASYIIFAVIYLILVFTKIEIIKGLMGFPSSKYYREVILVILPVTLFAFIAPALVYFNMDECLLRTVIVTIVSGLSTSLSILTTGLTHNERIKILDKVFRILHIKK